jgi:hypothetical protein
MSDEKIWELVLEGQKQTRAVVSDVLGRDGVLFLMQQDLGDVKQQLVRMNGCVQGNAERSRKSLEMLDDLPCGEHTTEIALLKKDAKAGGANWQRILSFGIAVVQALVIGGLIYVVFGR